MEEIAISKFKATCLAVFEKVKKTGQPVLNRFLAATAIAFDLILATADQKLIGVPGLKVLVNV